MSFGYPVMLELAGRRCVVIGAQAIREGKVEGLLAAGADDVLVVEPSRRRSVRWTWRACGSSGARGGPMTWTERSSPSPRRTTPPRAPRSPGRHGRAAYSSM